MKKIFRKYKESDYLECEELVNRAWDFDGNLQPSEFANLAKYVYTQGSVLSSNHFEVVEIDGVVVGFIFGRNERKQKTSNSLLFGIGVFWRLLWLKFSGKKEKSKLVKALVTHEKNRSKLVLKGQSEIILFVVCETFQGKGLGKQLMANFLESCGNSGVNTVVVETNQQGAGSFYEQEGFQLLADFDSPLHEYAIKGGQACVYEYRYHDKFKLRD